VLLLHCRKSIGRALNDGFLWAIACDRAAYWLMWDDAHICSRPFLASSRRVLESPHRWEHWQLMLTSEWVDQLPEIRKIECDGYRYILPRCRYSSDNDEFLDHACPLSWPGFTLTPSWQRLVCLRKAISEESLPLRPFSEHTFTKWDELQRNFGEMWEKAGAVNAQLLPSPAFYSPPSMP
jgi:hypothetical protein